MSLVNTRQTQLKTTFQGIYLMSLLVSALIFTLSTINTVQVAASHYAIAQQAQAAAAEADNSDYFDTKYSFQNAYDIQDSQLDAIGRTA